MTTILRHPSHPLTLLGCAFALGLVFNACTTPGDTRSPASGTAPVTAGGHADFSGWTVTLITSVPRRDGPDAYAQVAARFLESTLPGNPKVTIRNITGRGGADALQTAMAAPSDGLTLALLDSRLITTQALGASIPDFDLERTTFLGTVSYSGHARMLAARRGLARSWADVMASSRPFVDGRTGAGTGLVTAFLEGIGKPIRVLHGYESMAEVHAAFFRGEVDLNDCGPEIVRLFPEWVEERLCAPLFWYGPLDDPHDDDRFMGWLAALGQPVPPHIFDVVDATEEQQEAFQLAIEMDALDRVWMAPPGVPEPVARTWRSALDQVAGAPSFQEVAEALEHDAGYAGAETIQEIIDRALVAVEDPERRDTMRGMFGFVE